MNITFTDELNPTAPDIKRLCDALKNYNESIIGSYKIESYLISAYRDNEFIGGGYATLKFGWLYIEQLWVNETYRKNGIGKTILQKMENFAQNKNINYVKLNTGNFQKALTFYQKNGYEIFAELEIFPENGNKNEVYTEYFLKKKLSL